MKEEEKAMGENQNNDKVFLGEASFSQKEGSNPTPCTFIEPTNVNLFYTF
ncbi:MAG: hypothetical protein N3F10_01795 [Candidatus Bathyarchaeota archaeon]|nr:hypothetical protein [Candidatus Bathyarchaeota archaeon]